MLDFLRTTMVSNGTIDVKDVDRFLVTDSPEEIANHISHVAVNRFGLRRGVCKPRWWLFESPLTSTNKS